MRHVILSVLFGRQPGDLVWPPGVLVPSGERGSPFGYQDRD